MTDCEKFGLRVESLTFNDGTEITLTKNGILVLTGANNCGKSQTLRDLVYNYFDKDDKCVVVKAVKTSFVGKMQNLFSKMAAENRQEYFENAWNSWLEEERSEQEDPYGVLNRAYRYQKYILLDALAFYMTYLNTASRLFGLNEEASSGIHYNVPNKYFTRQVGLANVFENVELEDKMYRLIESAFGKGVLLTRASCGKAYLHYISKSSVEMREDRGKPSFSRWFESQPPLDARRWNCFFLQYLDLCIDIKMPANSY